MLRKAGRGEFRALLQGRRLYLRARRDGAEEDTLGWRPRLVRPSFVLGGYEWQSALGWYRKT